MTVFRPDEAAETPVYIRNRPLDPPRRTSSMTDIFGRVRTASANRGDSGRTGRNLFQRHALSLALEMSTQRQQPLLLGSKSATTTRCFRRYDNPDIYSENRIDAAEGHLHSVRNGFLCGARPISDRRCAIKASVHRGQPVDDIRQISPYVRGARDAPGPRGRSGGPAATDRISCATMVSTGSKRQTFCAFDPRPPSSPRASGVRIEACLTREHSVF